MIETAALATSMIKEAGLFDGTLDNLKNKKAEVKDPLKSTDDYSIEAQSAQNLLYGGGSKGQADKDLAKISQLEYQNYLKFYRPKELELIDKAKNDDSLITQAVEDAQTSVPLMQGIADRNSSRYGGTLTAAQQQQQGLQLQQGNTLGGIQGIRDARVAQKDQNRLLMADLINIGQGVNRSSMQQLSTAAKGEVDRRNANSAMRAQRRAQNTQMAGTAITAMMFM